MTTRVKGHLRDVVTACERLRRYTQGKRFADYLGDDFLRSAVERQFEIIGEATKQRLRIAPELSSSISNSAEVIGFRNNLIHRYASVQHEVVWDVLQYHMPVLEADVTKLLEQADEPNEELLNG